MEPKSEAEKSKSAGFVLGWACFEVREDQIGTGAEVWSYEIVAFSRVSGWTRGSDTGFFRRKVGSLAQKGFCFCVEKERMESSGRGLSW